MTAAPGAEGVDPGALAASLAHAAAIPGLRGTDQTLGELFRPPLPSLAPEDAAITVGDLIENGIVPAVH